jgi:hypothetical protein
MISYPEEISMKMKLFCLVLQTKTYMYYEQEIKIYVQATLTVYADLLILIL